MVKQQDGGKCPPGKGRAVLKAEIPLIEGWVPEANYSVSVRAFEGERTIFDLGGEMEVLVGDIASREANNAVENRVEEGFVEL